MRLALLALALTAILPPATPAHTRLQVLITATDSAHPTRAKVRLVTGSARVVSAMSGTVSPNATWLLLPARIELTEGAQLALQSDGQPLAVASDAIQVPKYAVSGPQLLLSYKRAPDRSDPILTVEAIPATITPAN